MRGALIILAVVGLIVGGYNCYLLVMIGSAFWIMWGLVFGLSVPVLAIVQAWRELSAEPSRERVAAAILTGSMLVQGAMQPLAERVLELSGG